MKSRKNSAFTLVELLVVISIVAILLFSIAACSVGGYFAYKYVSDNSDKNNTEQVDTEQKE